MSTVTGVCKRLGCAAALVVIALAFTAGASARPGATPGPKAYFVLGKQLVGVPIVALIPRGAVTNLLAGPRTRSDLRTFVPKGTRVLHASRSGSTATVDLSAVFATGRLEWRRARLAQLVYTVTSLRGVRSVAVLVGGEVPTGFPPFDLSEPLTRTDIARPKKKLRPNPQPRLKPPSAATRKLQQRLADLSFLPFEDVDGRLGPETSFAITAFQKWAGLGRDGVAGPATTKALSTAARPTPIVGGSGQRIEVLLDRQLALLELGSRVMLTVPVSTGKGVNATPPGSFSVFRKEVKSWSYPFQEWLPWASYFNGGIAFHEYPDVPTSAASHGCVRVPQYWSQRLYHFAPIGTPIRVLTHSLRR
jgi:L,D-transpeptidase-like protein/sporulation and spore germination protein/putative peptidoglycan binding protein